MRISTLALVFALLVGSLAQAGSYQSILNDQFDFNRGAPQANQKHQLGTIVSRRVKRTQKCVYNYAVVGGSTASAVALLDEYGKACKLPQNAVVTNVYIDTITALNASGSGATVAISTGQTAADLKTATGYTGFSGIIAGIPVGTAATSIKLTADRSPTATIATAQLIAGKFNVEIEYFISD